MNIENNLPYVWYPLQLCHFWFVFIRTEDNLWNFKINTYYTTDFWNLISFRKTKTKHVGKQIQEAFSLYFTFCAKWQQTPHLFSYCVLLHGKKKLLLCWTGFLHHSQEVTSLLLHVLLVQPSAKLCSVQTSST